MNNFLINSKKIYWKIREVITGFQDHYQWRKFLDLGIRFAYAMQPSANKLKQPLHSISISYTRGRNKYPSSWIHVDGCTRGRDGPKGEQGWSEGWEGVEEGRKTIMHALLRYYVRIEGLCVSLEWRKSREIHSEEIQIYCLLPERGIDTFLWGGRGWFYVRDVFLIFFRLF